MGRALLLGYRHTRPFHTYRPHGEHDDHRCRRSKYTSAQPPMQSRCSAANTATTLRERQRPEKRQCCKACKGVEEAWIRDSGNKGLSVFRLRKKAVRVDNRM